MAGAGRYGLYNVKVDSTVLDQITSDSFSPNPQLQPFAPLGALDPTAILLMGSQPAMQFSTTKIAQALAAIGISGLDCTTGIEFGYVERSQGGGFEASGEKAASTKCLIVPDSIGAAQDSPAEISYTAMPYSSDGTTAPLTHSTALVTGSPAAEEYFTLSSVTVAATPLGKPMSWSLDFGLGAEILKSGGNLYGTDAVIRTRGPSCTVMLADLGELSTARMTGAEVTSVVLTLKKLSTTGGGYAGSGDVTITMGNAFMHVSGVSGSHPGDASVAVRFMARKGAGAILSVA